MTTAEAIEIRALRKRFGSTTVLHGIDVTLRPGEVIGLMGPNGAGKSTLLKTLGGLYTADAGEIRVGGEVVRSLARRSDVALIHQDLGLVDALSVTENLRIGQPPTRLLGPILDHRAEERLAHAALSQVGLRLRPSTLVSELSPAEKTLVAIARALAAGASTLFVDEATSTLTSSSAARVIDVLRDLAHGGAIVVLITHKLAEVLDSADRVVVLMDGRIVADDPATGLDRESLIRKMSPTAVRAVERPVTSGDTPAVELLRLDAASTDRLAPVTLTVSSGEVVGLTGTPGSGLHDVGLMATGALTPSRGRVTRADGVRCGLVPPYRETDGGFDELSVRENMAISALTRWRRRTGLLDGRRESADIDATATRLALRPSSTATAYGVLSGGNKQKAIFGRLLLQSPDVFVLCEPTRGVDVATRAEIYALIHELRAQGKGVLVLSSDGEDLLAVCDRVGVVDEQQTTEPVPSGDLSTDQLKDYL